MRHFVRVTASSGILVKKNTWICTILTKDWYEMEGSGFWEAYPINQTPLWDKQNPCCLFVKSEFKIFNTYKQRLWKKLAIMQFYHLYCHNWQKPWK